MTDPRVRRFAALGDATRLAVVEALLAGDASPSELSRLLRTPGNLMAHHLDVLNEAGLIERRQSSGDRRRSYVTLVPAHLPAVQRAAADAVPARVLFVCRHNSARSVLAEALWTEHSTIPAASAGTSPARAVRPGTKAVAGRRGLRLRTERPQHIDDVARADDLVVSVCDQVFEDLPQVPRVHWSIPDPGDSDADFDAVFDEISARVTQLNQQYEGVPHV